MQEVQKGRHSVGGTSHRAGEEDEEGMVEMDSYGLTATVYPSVMQEEKIEQSAVIKNLGIFGWERVILVLFFYFLLTYFIINGNKFK